MKKKVYLFGGPSNSVLVASVIDRIDNMEIGGVINDYVEAGNTFGKYKKIPVIGNTEKLLSILEKDHDSFVISTLAGSTNPEKSYNKLCELRTLIPRDRWINVIDPTSVFPYEYCKLGVSIFVGPLAQIFPNTIINDFCILMPSASVGHDVELMDFVHVTCNAVVGSSLKIDIGTHVGTNSVIREGTNIGKYSIIGSGAVVLKDVDDYSVVVGNPARFLKKRQDCSYGLNSPHYIPFS